MKKFLCIVLTLFFFLPPRPATAWSEGGHHIISLMAFRLLSEEEQKKLLAILEKHPRWSEDFRPPANVKTEEEQLNWRIGRAGYWPDVARRQPTYSRSKWHYELGAALILGDKSTVNVPDRPGPLPEDADMETQDLYISQALELCKRVMADEKQSEADRALALCWISHLVADAHQPCHAGSLYMEKVFVESDGDRGANRIVTKERGNLHALWDQLLGDKFSAAGTRRRIAEMRSDEELLDLAKKAVEADSGLDPQTWLAESRQLATENVYTPEVIDSLHLVSRGILEKPEPISLSEPYLKNAGRTAQRRAMEAAVRLAETWRRALN